MTTEKNYIAYRKGGCPIYHWTKGVPFDENAKELVEQVATLRFVYHHLAVMPDVHWGAGCSVGTVLAFRNAAIPAAVGYDIGCGMLAFKTSYKEKDLNADLPLLRKSIEAAVPHGRTPPKESRDDVGAWAYRKEPKIVEDTWRYQLKPDYEQIIEKYESLKRANSANHLGTLGTGNHFIELSKDENNHVWIVIHSGSRGIGHAIATLFIKKAKKIMEQYFIKPPNPDLAYLPNGTPEFKDYMFAVQWAQKYAKLNRFLMLQLTYNAVKDHLKHARVDINEKDYIDCHHNYIAWEHHYGNNVLITRKGAVRLAGDSKLGIIPGSMGSESYIVSGKENGASFNSCSHGAGRVMSRTKAKKDISVEQHEEDVKNVECRETDRDLLEESPKAYKDIKAVMAAQSDLVNIEHTLNQLICVKG